MSDALGQAEQKRQVEGADRAGDGDRGDDAGPPRSSFGVTVHWSPHLWQWTCRLFDANVPSVYCENIATSCDKCFTRPDPLPSRRPSNSHPDSRTTGLDAAPRTDEMSP